MSPILPIHDSVIIAREVRVWATEDRRDYGSPSEAWYEARTIGPYVISLHQGTYGPAGDFSGAVRAVLAFACAAMNSLLEDPEYVCRVRVHTQEYVSFAGEDGEHEIAAMPRRTLDYSPLGASGMLPGHRAREISGFIQTPYGR